MLKRVPKRYVGLKEREIVQASEALIYSRLLYHLPHLNSTRTQTQHLERTFHKPLRVALGVLSYTPYIF